MRIYTKEEMTANRDRWIREAKELLDLSKIPEDCDGYTYEAEIYHVMHWLKEPNKNGDTIKAYAYSCGTGKIEFMAWNRKNPTAGNWIHE